MNFFDRFFNKQNLSPLLPGEAQDRTALESDLLPVYGHHPRTAHMRRCGEVSRRGLWDKPFGVPIGNGPDLKSVTPPSPPSHSNNSPTDSLTCLDPGCGDIRAGEIRPVVSDDLIDATTLLGTA